MRQRKGVALLTVVILAALILVAIVGMSRGLVAETAITKTDTGFKSALAVAETGLTQTSSDLASATWTAAGSGSINLPPQGYLTLAQAEAIARAPVDGVLTFDWKSYPDGVYPQGTSAFRVKVRKTSGAVWDGVLWDGVSDSPEDVGIRMYALGESYFSAAGSTSGLLGRRIVSTEATVRYDLHYDPGSPGTPGGPPTPGSTAAFNYGLFSGGDMTFQGSPQAVVTNGNIYALGNIDLGGKRRLDSGHTVYSSGTVTGAKGGESVVDKGSNPPPPIVPFPELSLGFYYDMANDFKTGSNYYAGNQIGFPQSAGYPDTQSLTSIIQSYLGAPNVSPTLAGVQTFYNDLKSGGGAWALATVVQRTALLNALKCAVYYIEGGGTIAGQFSVLGAVVVSGAGDPHVTDPTAVGYPQSTTVHLSGGSSIIDPGGLAFFVHGDIKGTGKTDLEGLLYSDGEFDNGSGQCTVNGAVVARNMTHLSGQFTVNYSAISNMPNGGIGGTAGTDPTGPTNPSVRGSITLVTRTSDTWTEKDLQAFNNAS